MSEEIKAGDWVRHKTNHSIGKVKEVYDGYAFVIRNHMPNSMIALYNLEKIEPPKYDYEWIWRVFVNDAKIDIFKSEDEAIRACEDYAYRGFAAYYRRECMPFDMGE